MQNLIFESSITGLFRLILIIFLIYTVFSLLVRYILPQLVRNSVRNLYNRNHDENVGSRENIPNKEGEVTIEYIDEKTRHPKKNSDDEYVDFEEIR